MLLQPLCLSVVKMNINTNIYGNLLKRKPQSSANRNVYFDD